MEDKNRVLIEAERKLLAVSIYDNESLQETLEIIKPNDFLLDKHFHIYSAISNLSLNGSDINSTTISNWLMKNGLLKVSGGLEYLGKLNNFYQGSERIGDIRKIIYEASKGRQMISVARDFIDSVDKTEDVEGLVFNFQSEISNFDFEMSNKTLSNVGEVAKDINNELKYLETHKDEKKGITTGFKALDRIVGSFEKKTLIICGARPSQGKSAFSFNTAMRIAMDFKQREINESVLILSLEMGKESVVKRMISTLSAIPSDRLRGGNVLTQGEWNSLQRAQKTLSSLNLLIDDKSGVSLGTIRNKLLKAKREHNTSVVVIDYLTLISSEGLKTKTEYEAVSKTIVGLKNLAKELDMLIIVLSQLNRNVEARQDKRPMLSDLSSSGVIEAAADIAMLLYRASYYSPQENRPEIDELEVIVAKNRSGSVGVAKLEFHMREGAIKDKTIF